MTIVSKQFCSSYQATLVVRKRPNIVNGGGFVVIDSSQKVVFKVDGYDFLGKKEELFLKDGEGHNLLLIRRKGGLVEALSIYKQWRGYTLEFEGSPRPIFTVKKPNSCFVNQNLIKISIDEVEYNKKDRNFEIKGYFADRTCSIINSKGNVIAQIGKHAEVERVMATNELYHVVVKPGVDQAFVFGVIAVLDFIHEGSTRY